MDEVIYERYPKPITGSPERYRVEDWSPILGVWRHRYAVRFRWAAKLAAWADTIALGRPHRVIDTKPTPDWPRAIKCPWCGDEVEPEEDHVCYTPGSTLRNAEGN